MRTNSNGPAPVLGRCNDVNFTNVGRKVNYFFGRRGPAGNGAVTFTRNNGTVSCVIKNISIRSLVSTYGSELVTNGDFSATTGWTLGTSAAITGNALVITNAATNSTTYRTITTPAVGKWYEVKFSVTAISAGSVRFVLYGAATQKLGTNRTAVGVYTEVVQLDTAGGSFPNSIVIQGGHAGTTTATVDNVSVKEITLGCNPLQLVNTTADKWVNVPCRVNVTGVQVEQGVFVFTSDGKRVEVLK